MSPEAAALSPEVNYALLAGGATSGPMDASSAMWVEKSTVAQAAIAEALQIIARWQAEYKGTTAENALSSFLQFFTWQEAQVVNAATKAARRSTAAQLHKSTVVAMPQPPEMVTNHTVHGVLQSTNFLGINTAPIAANEAEYFSMWGRAAALRGAYSAGVTAAAAPIPTVPPPMLTVPGAEVTATIAAAADAARQALTGAVAGVQRAGAYTAVDAGLMKALAGTGIMNTGFVAQTAGENANNGRGQAENAQVASQGTTKDAGNQPGGKEQAAAGEQFVQQIVQQVPSLAQGATQPLQQIVQLPQQLGQTVTQGVGQAAGQFSQFAANGNPLATGGVPGAPVIAPGTLAAPVRTGPTAGATFAAGTGGVGSSSLRMPGGWTGVNASPKASIPTPVSAKTLTEMLRNSGAGSAAPAGLMPGARPTNEGEQTPNRYARPANELAYAGAPRRAVAASAPINTAPEGGAHVD